MIKGISVTLYKQTQIGTDSFGAPIYSETTETVDNVLVAPVSGDEIINDLSLYGKKAVYQLAIPKGDTHEWENVKIEFFGDTFISYGASLIGIEDMIPLNWNRKVKVARYE